MRAQHCLTEVCTGGALLVFNGIDLICGSLLLVYGSYIGYHEYAPEWLYAPLLALGSFILFTVTLSWCGAFNMKCSVLLPCSSNLFLLLALMELAFSIIIMAFSSVINQFLRDHQIQLKLSDKELKRVEDSKFIPAYLLLGLCVMELLRFGCSLQLFQARRIRMVQYRRLQALDELETELLESRKEKDIEDKFASLRSMYQHKYGKKANHTPESVEGVV